MTLLFGGLGLVLLFFGGEALVRGASSLALRLGLTPLAVGLTVVAFGTSAPELVVSVNASLKGVDGVALGNVIGSNICNVGLILGLAALVRPLAVHTSVLRLDAPLVLLASLALVAALRDGTLSRPEALAFLLSMVLYTAWTLFQARRAPKPSSPPPLQPPPAESAPDALVPSLLRVGLGLGALVLGGQWMVSAAVDLARSLGVSDTLIGLTIVAVGTSLPELVTSVLAAARGQGDIAIGNVLGSNAFNLAFILGSAGLVHPLASRGVLAADLFVMVAYVVVLLPFLFTARRLSRGEGAALLVGWVVYTGWRVGVATG